MNNYIVYITNYDDLRISNSESNHDSFEDAIITWRERIVDLPIGHTVKRRHINSWKPLVAWTNVEDRSYVWGELIATNDNINSMVEIDLDRVMEILCS